MMPSPSHRWYLCFSRGLLGYLLGLYLLGFSWHLNSHEHSGIGYHQTTVSGDHTDAVVSSDTACFLCDWLVHHAYISTDALQAEIAFEAGITPYHSQSANICIDGLQLHHPSRAPPAVG